MRFSCCSFSPGGDITGLRQNLCAEKEAYQDDPGIPKWEHLMPHVQSWWVNQQRAFHWQNNRVSFGRIYKILSQVSSFSLPVLLPQYSFNNKIWLSPYVKSYTLRKPHWTFGKFLILNYIFKRLSQENFAYGHGYNM